MNEMTSIIKRLVGGIALVSIYSVIMFIVSANTGTQQREKGIEPIEKSMAATNSASQSYCTTRTMSGVSLKTSMRNVNILGQKFSFPTKEIDIHSVRVPAGLRFKESELKTLKLNLSKYDTLISKYKNLKLKGAEIHANNVELINNLAKDLINDSIADVQPCDTIS